MERAEAIKKIRQMSLPKETMEILEALAPELKESEDERIRKHIIEILNSLPGCYWYGQKEKDDTISYLEKQKDHFRDDAKMVEQKPADEQFPPLEGLDAIKAKYYDDGFKNGFDEGVASVKPAEWSEEDEKMINHIIEAQPKVELTLLDKNIINAAVAFVEQNDHFNCWGGIDKNTVIKALRSLRPQSKIQYWTEEEIEPIISDYLTGKEHYGGMIARLKCLKPKSSWKPSEEELVALKRVGSILRDYGHGELAKTVFMIEGKLANLDVLNKPMWKPNEEQMKALNALNLYGNLSYVGQQNQLISLYQDLKKLM